jgi:hypothetical protein
MFNKIMRASHDMITVPHVLCATSVKMFTNVKNRYILGLQLLSPDCNLDVQQRTITERIRMNRIVQFHFLTSNQIHNLVL